MQGVCIVPRERKPKPTKRTDGRFVCRYHDKWFYSTNPEDCLRQREEFKEEERRGRVNYFVREYAVRWFDRSFPNVTPSTRQGLRIHLQTLIDEIGDLPVSGVKPSDIKGIYSGRYATLSNSYILAAKQLFCALFDSAVADGLIASNPARDRTAKPHRGTFAGHRAITPQEIEWVRTLCTDHRAHPVAMAMLYAGLRPQEAKALLVERDVDFTAETITVRETAHIDPQNGQKYAITGKGKTERANRRIPLLPPLKQALQGKRGYLVTSAHGEPITRTTWRVLWNSYRTHMETAINGVSRRWYGRTKEHRAIIAAGGKIPPWKAFDVSPYDLRHTFATICRSMSPPIEIHTVIAWMGHADAKMILKVYDEVTDSREASEADRLRSAFL